ncbi:MAG: tRNA (adenosine(37)-N6)-threonylcarbamoyltransferase complex transferase subunit TsaD [Deltaproteobacteria bacterium]|nr:tRNA (adenosine(37)-N6)-threonylcarbamoyltransferase complex transferase subunit TsaD [Deltaproteobacteria bacterium]
MIVLALETSCDETAAALLEVAEGREGAETDRLTAGTLRTLRGTLREGEGDQEPRSRRDATAPASSTSNQEHVEGFPTTRVLSDVVASQIEEHAPYGGVVPELASRRHLTAILPVIRRALADAGRTLDDVQALAVTAGPGLIGSLLIGIQAAKAIAHAKRLPLIGVNHLAAHLLSSHLRRSSPDVAAPVSPGPPSSQRPSQRPQRLSGKSAGLRALLSPPLPPLPSVPSFPYVGLVVSGGHTALYAVWGLERFAQLAATRDDAAGEAFDKVGKLLGLPYPGGPAIDAAAAGIEPGDLRFPRGLDRKDTLDFSFSGLKTAVADRLRARREPPDPDEVRRVAAAFQESVVASLVKKSLQACERLGIPRLTLGGGVAANRGLRRSMAEACRTAGVELYLPARSDCTDNAAMVGLAAAPRLLRGEDDGGSLAARSSWPIG